jgi:adenosylcobinamide-GDP ribazoletransferase
VRALAAATMLLTRVPVPASAGTVAPARAAVLYPAVGAAIGAVVAGVALGAGQLWPVLLAATVAVAAETALTGALHLDGLADCADGLAGRDREQRLRIMKDHVIGVYAAATVALHLVLKVAALASLLAALRPPEVLLLLIGAYAASRGSMLPLARFLPYARAEGTGRGVVQALSRRQLVSGLALTLGGLAAVVPVHPWTAVWMALTAALVTLAVGVLAHRRIGGVTGDVLGACAELTLVVMLLASTATLAPVG